MVPGGIQRRQAQRIRKIATCDDQRLTQQVERG